MWGRLSRRINSPRRNSPGERFLNLAAEARSRIREISPQEAARMVEEGAILVDVRERGEYQLRHANGAENYRRGLIELEIEHSVPDAATPIVCYCSEGNRSALAADNLQRMGYQNVRVIRGGLSAWIEAELPTSSEREMME